MSISVFSLVILLIYVLYSFFLLKCSFIEFYKALYVNSSNIFFQVCLILRFISGIL